MKTKIIHDTSSIKKEIVEYFVSDEIRIPNALKKVKYIIEMKISIDIFRIHVDKYNFFKSD